MTVFPVENHRNREDGSLVYPVHSRRSGGLSIGINLFPDKKWCPFDCPYCEIFPFATTTKFAANALKDDLANAVDNAQRRAVPIRDICFSGNGEPTLSPHFEKALEAVRDIQKNAAPDAKLVVITCGAGLFQDEVFSCLQNAAASCGLDVWLKLDAGTEAWYCAINRSAIPFDKLIAKIKEFVGASPVTLQTMLCSIGGTLPSDEEEAAWNALALELAKTGNVKQFQLYGKARPSANDPCAEAVPASYLEKRAKTLEKTLACGGVAVPVSIYT
jgi:histidinol dehydrogenase